MGCRQEGEEGSDQDLLHEGVQEGQEAGIRSLKLGCSCQGDELLVQLQEAEEGPSLHGAQADGARLDRSIPICRSYGDDAVPDHEDQHHSSQRQRQHWWHYLRQDLQGVQEQADERTAWRELQVACRPRIQFQ